MLPNFIIGGTAPAGTGDLFSLLIQHPDVYLPLPMSPECNFFVKTSEYEKGLAYYEDRWFAGWRGQRAVGERSSNLLWGAWVPDRLRQHLPQVRLIFLFRNPVDRAYAHYRFTALAGFENLSFEEALEREEERFAAPKDPLFAELQPHAYFRKGRYDDQVRRYLERLPREQLWLMRSDRLLKDTEKAMEEVFRFLGVDPGVRVQRVSDFSSPSVIDLELQCALRAKHGRGLDDAIQRHRQRIPPQNGLDHQLRANLHDVKLSLDPDTRQRLTERYAVPNRRFQDIAGFDIEDWFR